VTKPKVTVLTIAGFDPSAGAGVLADVKTIAAFGCYGVAAVTSLTFQNTRGVFGAEGQSGQSVLAQLAPLFDDFEIAAVKTGMLPTANVINAVASTLASRRIPHVVVDPVVTSTSGYDLIDEDALRVLKEELFPLASIVTPNRIEAERIVGTRIECCEDQLRAARLILELGPKSVLVKGGDLIGTSVVDALVDGEGEMVFSSERIQSRNTHGTGCTLSAAIASLLALGYPLREAITLARAYVAAGIRSAPDLGRGHGPLNHFPPGFGFGEKSLTE
jgi:hydroxymethylpyrimidine kinase/phosphomethylpyrimidine kinase